MSPVFATIRFGPFSTEYHRRAVDEAFRAALDAYLTKELLPQVEEPFESTRGSLTAEVNEDRFCGPHSLVRDVYRLEFAFVRAGSVDELKCQIRRNPKTGGFGPRYPHGRLYLWTRRRKAEDKEFWSALDEIVRRVGRGEKGEWHCPRCGSVLRLHDLPDLFDLSCPGGCFNYNYHRDPVTKEPRHGYFFSRPLGTREGAGG